MTGIVQIFGCQFFSPDHDPETILFANAKGTSSESCLVRVKDNRDAGSGILR